MLAPLEVALLLLGSGDVARGRTLDVHGRVTSVDGTRVRLADPDPAAAGDGLARSAMERDAPPRTSAGFSLAPYSATPTSSEAEVVAIGEVTGDGRPDVVVGTSSPGYELLVFPQLAGGTLGAPVVHPYPERRFPASLRIVDLDEDGVGDVVIGNDGGDFLFLSDGAGGFEPAVVLPDLAGGHWVTMDVNRDGHADLVSRDNVIHGDGSGGFSAPVPLPADAKGWGWEETEDLNGDGVADLGLLRGGSLGVLAHDGTSGFVSSTDVFPIAAESANDIGFGDVTGDGLHDAAASRPRNSPTWLWILPQDAAGGFDAATTIVSYDIPDILTVTDIDGDGRRDVVVTHGGWNRLGVYLQRSPGVLDAEVRYAIPYASWYDHDGLAVGDFTGDGCADVAIADYNNGLVVLHGNGCAACAALPAARGVVAARLPTRDDLRLTWSPTPGADAYDVWRVDAKTDIPFARAPGGGVVTAVCGPVSSERCDATGVVPIAAGDHHFYQVRAACAGLEGP